MKYLFLHGLGQTAQAWDDVIARLSLPKEDVVSINLYQLTEGADRLTYDVLYRAFDAYCRSFPGPLCLCGLSLGGILAMDYASRHSAKVEKLILLGVQVKMPKLLLSLQNVIFRLLPEKTFTAIGLTKDHYISLADSMKALDFSKDLDKITMPVLIAFGQKDKFNKNACRELAGKLRHADCQIVENAGHEVNKDNPARLAEIIFPFLQNSP